MSMDYIRDYYEVPAKRGASIRFAGGLAVIVGSNGPHLRARMVESCQWADAGQMVTLHPTWEVEYEPDAPLAALDGIAAGVVAGWDERAER